MLRGSYCFESIYGEEQQIYSLRWKLRLSASLAIFTNFCSLSDGGWNVMSAAEPLSKKSFGDNFRIWQGEK